MISISLLNTAKLMDDNPRLLRLKELETLEKIAEKIEKLTVFGGLEGVINLLSAYFVLDFFVFFWRKI